MSRLIGFIAFANFLANSGNLEAVKIPNSKGMPRMSPIVKKTSNGSR